LLAVSWCRLSPELLQAEQARYAVEVAEWYADGGSGRPYLWEPGLVLTNLGYLRLAQNKTCRDVTHGYWPATEWWPYYVTEENIDVGVRHMVASGGSLASSQCVLFRDIVGNPCQPWYSRPCPECQGTGVCELILVGNGIVPCPECDGGGWQDDWEAELSLEDCLHWQDGTVPRLAQAIYEERAWERMPILADAFQEAGCENKLILDHCRGHVHAYQDNAVAYWYTDTSGPQLTPEHAAQAHQHTRGCWVVDLVLGRK
jgi:hypothetical protein